MSDFSSSSGEAKAAPVEEEETKVLQLKTDRAFAAFFHSLPPRPDTVRLFDRKTFYSAHGSDAHFLAETYFRSRTALRAWERTASALPLEYVAVREGIEFRAVLRLCLVEQRRRVEIYAVSPRSGRWELAKRASPGNFDQIGDDVFLDDVARSAAETAVAAAVAVAGAPGSRVVGVAYADFAAMELGVLEFPDDEQFTNLECALLQVGAKECFIPEPRVEQAPGSISAPSASGDAPGDDTSVAGQGVSSSAGTTDATGGGGGSGHKVTMERSARKLRAVLEKCNIPATDCRRADYSRKDIEQDLGTLLGSVLHNLPELELTHAMEALACLIKRLELLQMVGVGASTAVVVGDDNDNDEAMDQDGDGDGNSDKGDNNSGNGTNTETTTTTTPQPQQQRYYRLKRVDLSRYMKLDYAALRALNLVPGPGEGRSTMNLYNLLNRCKTAMGARRLLRWVKQPLVDVAEIGRRHDLVEEFVGDGTRRSELCAALRTFSDVDRLCKKLLVGKATLQDTVSLYEDCAGLEAVVGLLEAFAGACGRAERAALLRGAYGAPLARHSAKLRKYAALVEHLVDLDRARREHVYEINTAWGDELRAVDAARARARERMERLALQAAQDLGVKAVRLTETAQWGWVLRITKSDEKKLREHGGRYTALDRRGAGASGGAAGVRFTCRDLEALSAEHRRLSDAFARQSARIVAKVLEVARSYVPVFEAASDALADLDALLSLADVSACRNYVRPALRPLGAGRTVLVGARHPCVEAAALAGDALASAGAAGGDFVPNDVALDRDTARFVVVTGPNMGGKSTYIRQAGVCVVMAQIGCFVPCARAEITAVDAVLCRIGAGDSQLRGVSTFMAEMLETAAILAAASPNSLVIIDELGRGTSTQDGFGLACAIAEHICLRTRCFAFFATHFHELTTLADRLPCVKNLHVTAATVRGRLILQYKVLPGPCDRSFGIHVAELADFPQDVIAIARQKAAELEDFAPAHKKPAPSADTDADAMTDTPAEPAGASQSQLHSLEAFVKQFAEIPLDAISSPDDGKTLAAVKPLVDSFLASADPDTLALLGVPAAPGTPAATPSV